MKSEEEAFLRLAERGFLATADERGRATVVPVCFVYERGTIYSAVDAKPKSGNLARVANVVSRGEAAFIVDRYSTDWSKLSYLLVHGRARVVRPAEEAERARSLLVMKYPQYRILRLGRATVLALDVEASKFWRSG